MTVKQSSTKVERGASRAAEVDATYSNRLDGQLNMRGEGCCGRWGSSPWWSLLDLGQSVFDSSGACESGS